MYYCTPSLLRCVSEIDQDGHQGAAAAFNE